MLLLMEICKEGFFPLNFCEYYKAMAGTVMFSDISAEYIPREERSLWGLSSHLNPLSFTLENLAQRGQARLSQN